MNYPLRCRCGSLQGQVDAQQAVGRAICYCESCQAYARYLGREQEILNSRGGTEIIAALPRSVQFTGGLTELACVSLTEKGLLRWYANCCRTPIGNTSRNPRTSYVGLVRACLPGPDAALDERFGPVEISLNTRSARGAVSSTPAATFFAVGRIMKMVIGARLSGKYKDNPFFVPGTDTPVTGPHALTAEERRKLDTTA